ncbi:hypothetical protein I4990_00790 [Providencia alcalifaciens]|uniref:DUF7279 family protein n=1 Tax=Providencia alcalifaciens TaxID=126385 RepID=UPI0018C61812|nr:hypothetical protein [Providencia alcalifaciens]MBG5881491.1 hypothetical protein [Providencia alcalifaciens]
MHGTGELTVSDPVEVMVYYVNFNTNRRFWMLKVSAHGDEDHFKFQAKPTRKQIRKVKKQFIREAKEISECLVGMTMAMQGG